MIRTKRVASIRMIKDINITPFTDVCLVLLIIFMVTASALTKESNLRMNLPKASTAEAPLSASVTVRITSDQQIYVNDDLVTEATLKPKLKWLRDTVRTDLLVIKADEGIPYRLVIETIDFARQVGLDKIALATRQPEGDNVEQP